MRFPALRRLLFESVLEAAGGRRRILDVAQVLACFGRAVLAVHGVVLPLDRERALIANLVEGPDNLVEVDVASSDGAEVPATARIAKGQRSEERRVGKECRDRVSPK